MSVKNNIGQAKAIEQKNKRKLLEFNPKRDEKSGIYRRNDNEK